MIDKKLFKIRIVQIGSSGKLETYKWAKISATSKAEAIKIADKKYGKESVVASSIKKFYKRSKK